VDVSVTAVAVQVSSGDQQSPRSSRDVPAALPSASSWSSNVMLTTPLRRPPRGRPDARWTAGEAESEQEKRYCHICLIFGVYMGAGASRNAASVVE
jgi:hypothetical protein